MLRQNRPSAKDSGEKTLVRCVVCREVQEEDYARCRSGCQAPILQCRRNVRSSSFCKVESSALMGHGRNRRGGGGCRQRSGTG
jgi:hypothetical protein